MDATQAAIQEIASMTRKAGDTFKIGDYKIGWRNAAGELQTVDIPVKPMKSKVYRIDDLVGNVCRYHVDGETADIFYSRCGIDGFYNSGRRECVQMALTLSNPFEKLAKWDRQAEAIKQEALFSLLKTTFRGCCDDKLSKVIGRIKWTMGQSGDSSVKHGNISVNKSIVSEMTGADDLNSIEYVNFIVPVFLELPTVTAVIECHIKPIPDQQSFSIIPTGGHIENAYRVAEDAMRIQIGTLLSGVEGVSFYHGTAKPD